MAIRSKEVLDFDESCLEFVSFLGRGGFGSVSLMRDSSFQLYAKKSSPFHGLKNLEKERRIMVRFLNHPRIVQVSSPHLHIGTKPERCYIFMEFASKGTLHNIISNFRGMPMSEEIIGRTALMILEGLDALHSHGYVHCDIKPANVLLFPSTTFGEPFDLKLADFGLSKEPTDSRSLFAGTKQYMPPESFVPNGMVGPAVDIWSLGCVVLQMFGACPEKRGYFYSWRVPKLLSPIANDFVRRCMAIQPSHRASAVELLNHPFVAAQRVMSIPQRPELLPRLSSVRFPCVMRNNVMQEYPRRHGRPEMMMISSLKI